MSGAISDLGREILAVLLVGMVIKLMDDFLDLEIDALANKTTLAGKWGPGTLPYALLLFALALTANRSLALGLFLASYGVGMYRDWKRPLPLGLRGWQEALLAFALGGFILGWAKISWAFAVMTAVQLLDDLIDYRKDRKAGIVTFAQRLGLGETLLLTMITVLLSFVLTWKETLLVLAISPLVNWLVSLAGEEVK